MKLINFDDNSLLASKVNIADTFTSRFKGLMGRDQLLREECLIITPCNSIHTCFMKFPIDVVFLDKNWQVVRVEKSVRPWKFITPVKNAQIAVEFLGGTLQDRGLRIEEGDNLRLAT